MPLLRLWFAFLRRKRSRRSGFYIFVTIVREPGSEPLGNHGAEHPTVLESYVLCFMRFSTL